MKMLTISAILLLSGCASISGYVQKYTEVTCKEQVDITTESLFTASRLTQASYDANLINIDDKNNITLMLIDLTSEVLELNNICDTSAKEAATERLKEIEQTAEGL